MTLLRQTPDDYLFNLEALARYTQLFDEFMQHWLPLFPGQIITLAYEDLVTDPGREITRILAFLGLDFEPGVLSFHERVDRIRTASALQVRKPVRRDSIGRWRPFAKDLEPATSMLAPGEIEQV